MIASHLNDDVTGFVTKSFLVRFCEEEVEIEETVLFRAEIDVGTGYQYQEFYLDFELYFADLNQIGGAENWQSTKDIADVATFKLVQTQTYLVKSLATSILEYCPVTFTGQYFSVL